MKSYAHCCWSGDQQRRKEAHKQYSPGSDYETDPLKNRLQDGSIPDAIDKKNNIVRELKPNNQNAYKKGIRQVKLYLQQLEKQTGQKWKYAVDTYDVNANGTFTYHSGAIQSN